MRSNTADRRRLIVAAGLVWVVAGAGSAQAAGFALREGSADWMANAFAGDTAKAYDASTAWSNPAGMVRLQQSEIDSSLDLIFANGTFSGANIVGPGAITPGTQGGNLLETVLTGGLYGVYSVSPAFKLGLAVDSPFGQRVSNPTNFVGRYQSITSSISDVQIALSGAYRINDQWSIGGGPVIDVFSARLTQALNTGPLAAIAGDPVADLHATDVSVGYNIGFLYQPTPNLRFGLDYRSRIQHNVSGTQSVTIPPLTALLSPLTAGFLNAQNSPAGTKITLPDSVTGGVYWQVNPKLALLADISWTDWSLIRTINVVPTGLGAVPSSLAENWHNTVAISVGANYRVTDALMLQGGFGWDQSPVTFSNRTSRIPDSDRYLIGVGAQYDVMANVTLQIAYAHIFFDKAPIQNAASATSGLLSGTYTAAADTVAVGVKVKF
jgi:long-chain fatty acid transport protein